MLSKLLFLLIWSLLLFFITHVTEDDLCGEYVDHVRNNTCTGCLPTELEMYNLQVLCDCDYTEALYLVGGTPKLTPLQRADTFI
jgi:hypothetical protein